MRPITISIVLIHPSVHLELARRRQQELAADAERRRLSDMHPAEEEASRPGESEHLTPDASQRHGAPVVADVRRRAA